jgi:hypothetical protein
MQEQNGQKQLGGCVELQCDENSGPPQAIRFDESPGRPEAKDSANPQQVAGNQK